MRWLSLGVTLRFMQECHSALDLDETHSAAAVRRKMVGQLQNFGGAGRRSVVELYEGTRTLDGQPAVGEATVLVVHVDEMPFIHLAEALADYVQQHKLDPSKAYFWIAEFSRRSVPQRPRELAETVRVMRAAGRVVIALKEWDSAMPLELLAQPAALDALEHVHLATALPDRERARFERVLVEAPEQAREAMLAASLDSLREMAPPPGKEGLAPCLHQHARAAHQLPASSADGSHPSAAAPASLNGRAT